MNSLWIIGILFGLLGWIALEIISLKKTLVTLTNSYVKKIGGVIDNRHHEDVQIKHEIRDLLNHIDERLQNQGFESDVERARRTWRHD